MKRVFDYLKPYKINLVIGLSVKSSATLMELFLPFLLAYIIDTIIPTKNIPLVIIFGFAMLVSSVLAFFGNVWANRLAARISTDAIECLRNDTYEKILSFTNKTTDTFTIPSLISRMTTDTYHIYRMFNVIQRIGIRAPIILLGSLSMMLLIDTSLALVLMALLPVITFVVLFISKLGIPYYDRLQSSLDQLVRVVRENIAGIRIIKALAKEQQEKMKFNHINEDVSLKEKKAGYLVASLNPAMNLLLNLGLVIIVFYGANRVSAGTSSTGSIIAFLSYFTLILNSLLALNRIFLLISRANASSNRITQILDINEQYQTTEDQTFSVGNAIDFKDVSFSYNGIKNDLEHISFAIPHKTTFGIIGATGSGKSTIAQLLLRFYDIASGQILIDGKDIRSYSINDLRAKFGVVFQNDSLFSFSVKENIEFGREVDFDQVLEAANLAQAQSFIEQLSNQYDEKVLRLGANFSGGQRQRMLIARALANAPEIIILDDASSALDYKTDAELRQAIKTHYQSTTILIAQRVSTVLHADQICVLEDGKIVGLGNHKELIEHCPAYKELVELQLGEVAYV